MTCEACHTAEATHRVTKRSRSGRIEVTHYCEACCKELAGLPEPPPDGLYTLVNCPDEIRATHGDNPVVSLDELIKLLASMPGE